MKTRICSCLVSWSFLIGGAAFGDGRIIAIGDEWLLSDAAFSNQPAQTKQLTDNIANFFSQGVPSRFLVYSTSPAIAGYGKRGVLADGLANRMAALGHTWEINSALPFTLANLKNYQAVFLSGTAGSGSANGLVLQQYVNQGGNVLITAGTGDQGSSGAEASSWNGFLNHFGLAFGDTYFATGGNLLNVPTLPSTNPLGKFITMIEWGYGQNVTNVQPDNPTVELAVYGNFNGFSPLLASGPIQPVIGTVNITTKCLGDFNGDGFVDDADFVIFVAAYNLLTCDDPAMPPGCPADIYLDGLIDDRDFIIFSQSYNLLFCP